MKLSNTSHIFSTLRLCLIGMVTMCVMSSWASDTKRDSLTLEKKLASLSNYEAKYNLVSDALDTLDTDNPFYLVLANKMWDMASQHKDYETMSYAGYTQAIYYYNYADYTGMGMVQKNMRGLLGHLHDYSDYFYVLHLVIAQDVEQASFEYAIADVNRMEAEMAKYPQHNVAYLFDQTWGYLHDNFNEYSEALISYRKALKKLPKDDLYEGRIDIESEILNIYIKMKLFTQTDSLLESVSNYYGVNLEHPEQSKINQWNTDYGVDTYTSAAYICINKGEIEKAKMYLDHAQALVKETTYPAYKSFLHESWAEYYAVQKDSAQALTEINKAINSCTITELGWNEYVDLIKTKGRLQMHFSDKEGASRTYSRNIQFIDSLNSISANQQYAQLVKLYNLEGRYFQTQERERNYLLVALFVGLITLLIAARQLYRSYLIRKRELDSVAQIKAAKATADKANKAKYEFLNAFNDNIRTPLNAVVGFTDLMVTSPEISPQDLRGYATCIHRNSQVILTTVGNLLELSRMESNMVQLTHELVSIESFIEAIRQRMEAKGVGAFIIRDKADIYSRMIALDTHRFSQLFDSFLSAYGTDVLALDKIVIEVAKEVDDNVSNEDNLVFKITGSSLFFDPKKKEKGQERGVRNTINSIVVERTGGKYTVTDEHIQFTLPIQP